jgi:hypothetical protein
MTSAQRQCPRCGHLIDQPRLAEEDRDAVIASLREELRCLQETIAYLRGSLGSRTRPGWLAVPCATHTTNGTRNLYHVAAMPAASCRGTIMVQESTTIRRHHEHHVGPKQARFHVS